MKGLMIKEKNLILTSAKSFFIIPLFFVAAMIISVLKGHGGANSFPVEFIFMFMGIMPISLMNTELVSKWNINCLTLPYTRRQIVASKYVSTLIVEALTLIMIILMFAVCNVLCADMSVMQMTNMLFRGIGMGLIPAVAYLPMNFKMYDKSGAGRIVTGGLVGGLCGGLNIVFMEMNFSDNSIMSGSFWFMAAMIVLFAVSWVVSVIIFEKKDC